MWLNNHFSIDSADTSLFHNQQFFSINQLSSFSNVQRQDVKCLHTRPLHAQRLSVMLPLLLNIFICMVSWHPTVCKKNKEKFSL